MKDMMKLDDQELATRYWLKNAKNDIMSFCALGESFTCPDDAQRLDVVTQGIGQKANKEKTNE